MFIRYLRAQQQIGQLVEIDGSTLVDHVTLLLTTQRDVGQVLADALEMMWTTMGPLPERALPVSTLADEDVLALADAKMDPAQNERLGALQARGKNDGLTEAERAELLALLHRYQVGQLRKSAGLAEAVRRGLRAPRTS